MRRTLLGMIFALAALLGGSALAADKCDLEAVANPDKQALVDCIKTKNTQIQDLAETIALYRSALGNVWAILHDPTAVVGLAELDGLREEGEIGIHVREVYQSLVAAINPGLPYDAKPFAVLRAIYANPDALKAFYGVAKPL